MMRCILFCAAIAVLIVLIRFSGDDLPTDVSTRSVTPVPEPTPVVSHQVASVADSDGTEASAGIESDGPPEETTFEFVTRDRLREDERRVVGESDLYVRFSDGDLLFLNFDGAPSHVDWDGKLRRLGQALLVASKSRWDDVPRPASPEIRELQHALRDHDVQGVRIERYSPPR